MDSTFGDMITEGWLTIYMDDVLVFTETKEECQEQTTQVLKRMKEEDLHLKMAKCAFNQTSMEYLGLVVKDREVYMDPTKLTVVQDWKPPTLVKEVQSFISFCNFYRKFIPNFSALAWPLHDLTKKGVLSQWTMKQDDAFIKLKEIFLSAPIIQMPDISKPFYVMMDTSLTTLGGVLMQANTNGDLHPCAYHSQTFSPAEWNYNIYDWELLTVLHALKEWRHYLTGTTHLVTIITNHKNLGYFKQPQNLTHWQARWMLLLPDYDLIWGVEWGVNMGLANALSQKDEVDTAEDNHMVTMLPKYDFQWHQIQQLDLDLTHKIASSSQTDPVMTKAL